MDFKWLNQGEINIEDDRIEMVAPPQSDFFCNNGTVSEVGITPESLCNAPFYFTEVTGDFVMQVKVSHDFRDTSMTPLPSWSWWMGGIGPRHASKRPTLIPMRLSAL